MMQVTSLLSWYTIRDSKLLGERQKAVWLKLYHDGPQTGREVEQASGVKGAWKRLSELKALGLVEELPPRLCRVTKHAALAWRAVVVDPKRPEKKKVDAKCPTCGRAMKAANVSLRDILNAKEQLGT